MILRINGGMGNQMFQYACYKNLCCRGYNAKLDISLDNPFEFKLNIFPNIEIRRVNSLLSYCFANRYIRKMLKLMKVYGVENVDEPSYRFRLVNEGYFQEEKYFNDIKHQIIEEFIFPEGEQKLVKLVEKIRHAHNSVGIHFRRGDYIKLHNIYGGICTKQYYKSAISLFDKNTFFVVFSNDIKWVKDNFKLDNAIYIYQDLFDNYDDWYDMYLMSVCKNNIIANSTFSWWGAYLNVNKEKKVVCPVCWTNDSKRKVRVYDWIEIDPKGKILS